MVTRLKRPETFPPRRPAPTAAAGEYPLVGRGGGGWARKNAKRESDDDDENEKGGRVYYGESRRNESREIADDIVYVYREVGGGV